MYYIVLQTFPTLILYVLLHKGWLFWLMNYAMKSEKTLFVYAIYRRILTLNTLYIFNLLRLFICFMYLIRYIDFLSQTIILSRLIQYILYNHQSVLVLALALTSVRHGNFSKKIKINIINIITLRTQYIVLYIFINIYCDVIVIWSLHTNTYVSNWRGFIILLYIILWEFCPQA